ncbi:MAG: RNA polymerase sigma factor [Flavobacteriales bacterium]|nr:RNA polymerase sigma factor [Flavobacteriales bacterium]
MTLKEIYDEHKNLVYNVALQYVQNVKEAEEITQDVFLSIHEKLNTFKADSSLKTWIYRITVNKSLDLIKARKRIKRWGIFVSTDDETKYKTNVKEFNHPGVQLEQKEAMEKLFKAINELPENQKTALILLKIDDLKMNEAAEIMEVSMKAIESLFQRAKKNLAIKLNLNEGI